MNKFNIENRKLLQKFLKRKLSVREIASFLDMSPSTVYRELNRCLNQDYNYVLAHDQASNKKAGGIKKRYILGEQTMEAIEYGIIELHFSPEQIVGIGEINGIKINCCPKTIYNYINNGLLPRLKKKLRRKGVKYKYGCQDGKPGNLPVNAKRISQRPDIINKRKRVGDFEADTVVSPKGKSKECLLTLVDRKTRYLEIIKLPNRKATTVNQAIKSFLETPIGSMMKTYTTDRGSEFTRFDELEKETGIEIYFADPHSPWQKGTNENINGLIREFFPKNTLFSNVTHEEVKKVQYLINIRPRKTLKWKTPLELMNKKLKKYEK